MAWTAPRTWAAAEFVTETMMNGHVRDNENYLNDLRVKYATPLTTSVGPTVGTTPLDVITAPAFTPINSSRLLRVWFHCRGFSGGTAGEQYALKIQESTTVLAEMVVVITTATITNTGADFYALIANPSAAAHTYKATITRTSGAGTVSVAATATGPINLTVEDIGAA